MNSNDEYIIRKYRGGSLEGKIPDINCEYCRGNGCSRTGECQKCLKRQAEAVEYIHTHAFITYTGPSDYHDGNHDAIKKCYLRLPHERPLLFYGVEIEVGWDEDELSYSTIYDAIRDFQEATDGLFIWEEDCTIEYGYEAISRPCSYAYWTHPDTVAKLKRGFDILRDSGALVNQPDGHGLHVHASRAFFARNDNEADALRAFDWVFQKFQPEMERLGRRKYTDFCASKADKMNNQFYTNDYIKDLKVSYKVKRTSESNALPYGDHHVAVNTTPHTIEARVFKSTIDYKTLLATIEIVRNVCHASRDNGAKGTLDEILHTKPNLYLNEYLEKVDRLARRDKAEFDRAKENSDEIEVEFSGDNKR